MAKPKGAVGFGLDTMVQGGLIDDADVTFQNCHFETKSLGGADERVYFCATLKTEDGGEAEQFFSAADPAQFQPSDDDGNWLIAVGEKGALNKGTNFELLLASAVKFGFPDAGSKGSFDDKGAEAMNGLKAHVIRVPQPKNRSSLLEQNAGAGQKKGADPLVISKIIALPGGKAAKATPAATKGKAAKEEVEEATTGGGEVSELDEALREVLAGADKPIEKKKLVGVVYKALDQKHKTKGVKRVVEEEFLLEGAAAGLWTWEDDTLGEA